jgi:hypothetical protein
MILKMIQKGIGSIVIALVVAALFVPSAQAQLLSRGDLFGPGAPPPMIGVELGLGMHSQMGTYRAACQCEFTDGSQSGFLGGLLFELPLSYEWTVGLGAKFDFGGLNNSTLISDTATIRFDNPLDSVAYGIIKFQRLGTVRMTTLILNPFVKYEFYRGGPFVQLGPGLGFVLSSSFVHNRELPSSTVTVVDPRSGATSTLSGVTFENGSNKEELENDNPITGLTSMQLSIMLTAGFDLPVGENSVVAPMVTYSLPLSKIRETNATDWKISTLYISLGLKYKLD